MFTKNDENDLLFTHIFTDFIMWKLFRARMCTFWGVGETEEGDIFRSSTSDDDVCKVFRGQGNVLLCRNWWNDDLMMMAICDAPIYYYNNIRKLHIFIGHEKKKKKAKKAMRKRWLKENGGAKTSPTKMRDIKIKHLRVFIKCVWAHSPQIGARKSRPQPQPATPNVLVP